MRFIVLVATGVLRASRKRCGRCSLSSPLAASPLRQKPMAQPSLRWSEAAQ
jgi:hypothetical protein